MVKKPLGEQPSPYAGGEQPVRSLRQSRTELRPDLREAVATLWLRKWSIIAMTLLGVGVALLVSYRQTPIYESQVSILITPVAGTGSETDTLLAVPEANLSTEAELIQSVAVAQIVADELDIPGPPRELLGNLSVDQPTDTEILVVSYRNADPRVAQRMAAGFADAYLLFREQTVTEAILTSAADLRDQIDLVTDDFNRISRRLESLSDTDPGANFLESQANLLSTQILQLQLALVALPEDVTFGRVIEPAPPPSSAVSPNHIVNGVFGLVAGLGLGVGLAFLRDRLSERLRSSEEAEAYLEAPVLAAIPRVASWRRRRRAFLVTAVQWRSPTAEAYRVLRTNVLSAASAFGVKSIVVTSAHTGEGKSATVANLGVVLARAGKRVTLVSADLRRPRLHEFFRRDGEPGLIEVLAGQVSLANALHEVALPTRGFDTTSLRLLPSGHVPDDPSELITSESLAGVLKKLEDASDIVLIDVPPVLPVTDALVVAEVARSALLVIGPTGNTRPTIISARQQLDRVGARILGAVLNGPDASMTQTYYSY